MIKSITKRTLVGLVGLCGIIVAGSSFAQDDTSTSTMNSMSSTTNNGVFNYKVHVMLPADKAASDIGELKLGFKGKDGKMQYLAATKECTEMSDKKGMYDCTVNVTSTMDLAKLKEQVGERLTGALHTPDKEITCAGVVKLTADTKGVLYKVNIDKNKRVVCTISKSDE